ncbi:hypothetical protein GCM10018790_24260 [Kitasatospora xanthocidica]|nr:hypothetical protein GCM10018790_24260 [Kitasatospora xanthocidica]
MPASRPASEPNPSRAPLPDRGGGALSAFPGPLRPVPARSGPLWPVPTAPIRSDPFRPGAARLGAGDTGPTPIDKY